MAAPAKFAQVPEDFSTLYKVLSNGNRWDKRKPYVTMLLSLNGRPLPHYITQWEEYYFNNNDLTSEEKATFEFQSCLLDDNVIKIRVNRDALVMSSDGGRRTVQDLQKGSMIGLMIRAMPWKFDKERKFGVSFRCVSKLYTTGVAEPTPEELQRREEIAAARQEEVAMDWNFA